MGDYLEFFFTCSMPRPPFTIDPVIEDPVLLDIDNRVTKTLNVKGNRYAVKGWVRFDRSKVYRVCILDKHLRKRNIQCLLTFY